MIRIILSFLMLLTAHSVICAQAGNIADSILSHYKKLPHEKVYVHTDKPYYAAGDTIWFRAHVADAVTNSPTNKSKFVYVELLDNAADTLIERAMIKSDSSDVFANAIILPKSLRSGRYTIAAYTRWMMNFDKDLFFYKQVTVLGKGGDNGLTETDTMTDEQRDIAGEVNGEQPDMAYLTDISLALMPEGGNLVEGLRQRMAFKAIGNDGYGVDVRVRLVNASGEILSEGESEHLGMGYIYVTPSAADSLFLEAYSQGGLSCRAALPEVQKSGVALTVEQHQDMLMIQVVTTDDIGKGDLSCVVYGSGNVIVKEEIKNNVIKIDTKPLRRGIVTVAVVDKNTNRVYAERLAFIKADEKGKVEVDYK